MVVYKLRYLLDVCRIITRPFSIDLIGFFLFYLLFSGVQIIDRSCESLSYGLYMATFAFLQFYLFFYILTISHKVYKIVKPFLFIFLLVYFCIDLLCYVRFNCTISPDISAIICATNPQEAKEFLEVYFRPNDLIVLFIILLCSIGLYYASERIRIIVPNGVRIFITIILFIFICAIARNNTVIERYWQGLWKFEFNEVVDLSQHFVHPELTFTKEDLPDNIVIVIGESFTPTHSSLYGYPLETNPRLSQLQDDSLLYVFPHVTSPATHTIKAFKQILNTHLAADTDTPWYESMTTIELLHCLGYLTHWVSNQAQSGMYENVASSYAKICDSSFFLYDNKAEYNYDENLLTIQLPEESQQAVFYHLMGQHGSFEYRYPESFDVFSVEQYQNFPSAQIEPRRTYDNATLYNDYICSQILSCYESKEVIAFYFPDHGLDFYTADNNFYGHGRPEIPASVEAATQIPFMIYVSSACKQHHPGLISRILSVQNAPLCTDAFTFLLMELLQIRKSAEN